MKKEETKARRGNTNRVLAFVIGLLMVFCSLDISVMEVEASNNTTIIDVVGADTSHNFHTGTKDLSGNIISEDTYNEYLTDIASTVENPNYQWKSNGRTVTNVPITNWSRSSNYVSFLSWKNRTRYSWNWDTIAPLNSALTTNVDVWDSSRKSSGHYGGSMGNGMENEYVSAYNGKLYDSATWSFQGYDRISSTSGYGTTWAVESLCQFKGNFTLDKSLNISDLYFTMADVTGEGNSLFINDNMYVFIYPTILEDSINSSSSSPYYFMKYLAYWAGDMYTLSSVCSTFNGVQCLPTNGSSNITTLTKWIGWKANVSQNNVGSVIKVGYNQAKSLGLYDGNYTVRIIGSDTSYGGGGGMYRPILGIEYATNSVHYVANGATGTMENQTKTYNVPLVIKDNEFIYPGYNFVGWNTTADGSGTSYTPGDIYIKEAGLVLYAQWERTRVPYTVNHYQQNIIGNDYTLYETENLYAYQGDIVSPETKIYIGFISPDIQNVAVAFDGSTVIDYYYTRITYKIRFNGNNNWNVEQGSYTQDYTYGECTALTDNKFTKADATTYNNIYYERGYEFIGWGTSATQTTATYTDKQEVKNLKNTQGAVLDLYAIWKKPITLTFNFNGGKFNDSTTNQVLNYTMYNSELSHTFDIKQYYGGFKNNRISANKGINNKLTKTDTNGIQYRFLGYSLNQNATVPDSNFDVYNIKERTENYTIRDNTTLYAVWEPVLQMTVQLSAPQYSGVMQLTSDVPVTTTLGNFKISSGTRSTDIPSSATASVNSATIGTNVTNKNLVTYTVNAKGASNIKFSTAADSRILDIYTHGNNNTWFDKLNTTDKFEYTIDNFSNTTSSFTIPQYIGTKKSYKTSNPESATGTSVYAIKFTCTQPSYYYSKYWNSPESTSVYGILFLNPTLPDDNTNILPPYAVEDGAYEFETILN